MKRRRVALNNLVYATWMLLQLRTLYIGHKDFVLKLDILMGDEVDTSTLWEADGLFRAFIGLLNTQYVRSRAFQTIASMHTVLKSCR